MTCKFHYIEGWLQLAGWARMNIFNFLGYDTSHNEFEAAFSNLELDHRRVLLYFLAATLLAAIPLVLVSEDDHERKCSWQLIFPSSTRHLYVYTPLFDDAPFWRHGGPT